MPADREERIDEVTPYRLFAVEGWGSALTEAMLKVCGAPFTITSVPGFDVPGETRDQLLAANPLAQIPTLVLPDGTLMTESAAIALLLSERHPLAGLAPHEGAPERARFLRLLIWLVANIYPTFTIGDYPGRWVNTEPEVLVASMDRRRERLWREFSQLISPGPWVLGEDFSALDIYVCVMTRWRPGRAWFETNIPTLHAIALRCEAHPQVAMTMERNYPT